VVLGDLISDGPSAVMSLASPAMSSAPAAALNTLIRDLDGLLGTPFVHSALTHTVSGSVADHGVTFATSNTGDDDTAGTVGGLGIASAVGRLSVPPSWSTAAPATTTGTAAHGTDWAVPEDDGEVAAMPPAPGLVVAADTAGTGAGPRYGVKPTVMPKQGLF
jgi:PPE-repeat protein